MYTFHFFHMRIRTYFQRPGSAPASSPELDPINEVINQDAVNQLVTKIQEAFDENPELQDLANAEFRNLADQVFSDPDLYTQFVNKAFENRDAKLATLDGVAKINYLKQFSDFITRIALHFADKHDDPILKDMIQKRHEEYRDATLRQTNATQDKL